MKEYKIVGEDEYQTYADLFKVLNRYGAEGWEVVCTLGGYNHTLLLARTVLPKATYYGEPIEKEIPPQGATSASDDAIDKTEK